MTDNEKESSLAEVAREVSTASAGAAVGLILGGPAGAILGAAIPPVASALVKVAADAMARRADRINETWQLASERAGVGEDGLAARVLSDEEKTRIVLQGLGYAGEATVSQKRELLAEAMALAAASSTEIETDRASVLVDAIGQLQRVHLRLLAAIKHDPGGSGWRPTQVAERMQTPVGELRYVVRQLELLGILQDRGRGGTGDGGVLWYLTELGTLIADMLEPDTGQGTNAE